MLSGLGWDGQYLWLAVARSWLRCVNPATHDFERTLVVEGATRLGGAPGMGSSYGWWTRQGALAAGASRDRPAARSPHLRGGGLAWRDGQLWLGAPLAMRYEPQWAISSGRRARDFALLVIDAATGAEVGRHPLSFLPMGLAWTGDDLWLADSARGRLCRGRLA